MLDTTIVYASVRTPIRPSARASPSPATPSASADTTSGTTSMKSRRRKTAPIGSVTLPTIASTIGASPSVACTTTPRRPPTASPTSMGTAWPDRIRRD
jgi:hypothetical protein